MHALMKLKDVSIMDKNEKVKAKKLAQRLAGDVDLEDVFKEEVKKKDDIDI
jgi:hypothetical protein